MGDSSLSDVERPKLGNDLYKHPLRPQGVVTDPQDGMPRVASSLSMEDSVAPPLETETFVCMGDESAYVIRDHWGGVLLSVSPERARWYRDNGMEGWLAQLDEQEHAQAGFPTAVLGGDRLWFWVEPLRPQCDHYKRVMTDFEGSNEHKSVERVCSAQKTEYGEYVALGNTRVYACEHRLPRDFVSEDRLRKFDATSMALSKKADEHWDGEAALEAELRRAAKKEEKNNG